MKRINLLAASIMVVSIVFTSCGESKTESTVSDQATPETSEEVTEEATAVTIDLQASKLNWTGVMMGVYEHTGTAAIKEASLELTGDVVSSGSFTVDMTSLSTTDQNYDEEKTPEKLIGHLSSDDFFAVESNPTATFEITSVDGTKATGTLTVRGQSNEATVENIAVEDADGGLKITGTLTFNRQDYGVAFDMGMKDMVVSDDINLDIELVATR